MAEPADDVAGALGHRFTDTSLLAEALTHTSYTSEHEGLSSNQRLEFLGDAVLGAVIAHSLYADWDLAEGEMSKVRAAVVNEATLARIAREIGVGAALRLGRGEDAAGGRDKAPILADTMEALIGAVYLDAGFDTARDVILRWWAPHLEERAESPGLRDYKTRLQEILAQDGLQPEYGVESWGPDHARRFAAEVTAGGSVLGLGAGTSKKRAEQDAARRALVDLGHLDA